VLAKEQSKKNTPIIWLFCVLAGGSSYGFAGDVQFIPKIDTTIYVYDTKIGSDEPVSNEAIVVIPSILSTYSAKRVTASFAIDHTVVEQNDDINGESSTFTELKYNTNFSLIENVMNLTLNGAQDFRPVNLQGRFIVDPVLSPGDLTKVSNNAAALNFSIPNPKHLGFDFQSSISETKADESIDAQSGQFGRAGLNNDTLGVSARLYNGNYTRKYNFDLSAQHNKIARENFEDFSSSIFRGRIGFAIANEFDWVVTAASENYDIPEGPFFRQNNIDTSSFGAGIEWKPRVDRAILLNYNQLQQGNIDTEFVGVNVNWAFSNRTVLKLDYGKRFFGDAYNVDFSHNTKSIRTSLTYSQQVTVLGGLGGLNDPNNNSNGLFVCEFGSIDLNDCFQPSGLGYELQAGQEFRALTDIDSDITGQVLFRTSGNFNVAYDRRKIKASFRVFYTTTEFLESDRLQKTRGLGLNLAYALGRKTNISLNTDISKIQFNELFGEDTNTLVALNFTRDINDNLKLTAGARALDRESDNVELKFTDKRLTVGLNYRF
jgi:uncharacterized protein (PEP-CTERM system associated)